MKLYFLHFFILFSFKRVYKHICVNIEWKSSNCTSFALKSFLKEISIISKLFPSPLWFRQVQNSLTRLTYRGSFSKRRQTKQANLFLERKNGIPGMHQKWNLICAYRVCIVVTSTFRFWVPKRTSLGVYCKFFRNVLRNKVLTSHRFQRRKWKKKWFKNPSEALNFVRAKSTIRNRKQIKDYPQLIASYEKIWYNSVWIAK